MSIDSDRRPEHLSECRLILGDSSSSHCGTHRRHFPINPTRGSPSIACFRPFGPTSDALDWESPGVAGDADDEAMDASEPGSESTIASELSSEM